MSPLSEFLERGRHRRGEFKSLVIASGAEQSGLANKAV